MSNFRECYEIRLANKRAELIRKLNALITTLQYEVKSLEGCDKYFPNGCGIIQREKDNIDDLCKEINMIRDVLDMDYAYNSQNE